MPSDQTAPAPKPSSGVTEEMLLLLETAQNWVCDGCGHAWWEADAYQCPSCGQSNMHRWGERADER
jgi:rubrerythrin